MSRFTPELLDHFQNPRNAQPLASPDAVGRASRDGQAPRTAMFVVADDGRITKIGFQTFGCGVSIASASAVTDLALGRGVEECLAITVAHVEAVLSEIPSDRRFCAEIALEALRDAVRQLPSS